MNKLLKRLFYIQMFVLSGHVSAGDLLLPITLNDPEPQYYETTVLFPPDLSFSFQGYRLDGSAVLFTDSIASYDRVIWEFAAPAGQRYEVNPPGQAQVVMQYDLLAGNMGGALQNPSPVFEVVFLGLSGTAPSTQAVFSTFRAAGEQLEATWIAAATESFSFEGVRLIANGPFPAAQTQTYDGKLDSPSFYVEVEQSATFSEPFVWLVPEPGSLAMLGLGGLLVCRHRTARG